MSTTADITTQPDSASDMIAMTLQEASLEVIQGLNQSICNLRLKASIPHRKTGKQNPNYLIPKPEYGWNGLPPFRQLAIIANHSTTLLLRPLFQQEDVPTNHFFWIRFFDHSNRDDFGRIPPNSSTNNFGGRTGTNSYVNIATLVLPPDMDGQYMICYVDGKPVVNPKNDDMTNDRECWEQPFRDFVAKYGPERLQKLGLYMSEDLLTEWTKRVPDFKTYFLFIRTFKGQVCPGHMIVNDFLGHCPMPVNIGVKLLVRANTKLIDYSFLPTINGNKPMKVGPRTWNPKTGITERIEAQFTGEGECTITFFVEDTAVDPFTGVEISAEIVGMDIVPFEPIVVNYSNPMEIIDPYQLVTALWGQRKIFSTLKEIPIMDYVSRKKALQEFLDANPDFLELFNRYKDGKCPALPFLTHDKHENPSVQYLLSQVKETVPTIYTLVQESLTHDLLINRDEAIKAMVAKEDEIRKAERMAAIERDTEPEHVAPPPALPSLSCQMSDARPFVEMPSPPRRPQLNSAPLGPVPSCAPRP